MVEYGGGLSHGPAGQVHGTGGGGTPIVGHPVSSPDFGASIGNAFNDAFHTFSTLPFAEQALLVIVGLFVLYLVARRAF
jgi:hypothetical protein